MKHTMRKDENKNFYKIFVYLRDLNKQVQEIRVVDNT